MNLPERGFGAKPHLKDDGPGRAASARGGVSHTMPEPGVGLSLWLMPAEPAAGRFASVIAKIAARLGSPVFDPHVTLVGGLTLEEEDAWPRTRAVAAALAPVRVRLVRAGWRPAYFRCLYAEVEGEAIVRAHETARAVLRLPEGPPYEPHLSFAYADFTEVEQASLAVEVDRQLPAAAVLDTLRLMRTTGAVEEWERIADCRLAIAD